MSAMTKLLGMRLAVTLAMLLVAGQAVFAAERAKIKVPSLGAMQALKDAGISVNKLYGFQREDGSPYSPGDARKAPEFLYLPLDTKEDKAKTLAWLRCENMRPGTPVDGCEAFAAGKDRNHQLPAAPDKAAAQELSAKLSKAGQEIGRLNGELQAASTLLEKERRRIPWEWIAYFLFMWALSAAVLWYALNCRLRAHKQRAESLQNRLDRIPPDIAAAMEECSEAKERAEELMRELDEAREQHRIHQNAWNDRKSVQNRLVELGQVQLAGWGLG